MESTWETRDLPVLDAVVRYFEDHPDAVRLTLDQVADLTNWDRMDTYQALKTLTPTFVDFRESWGGQPDGLVWGVTDEARRVVGQWPTPEAVADRILAELLEAADREPDERKRTKLRAAADALGGFGRDLLVNVIANVATKPISF